MLWIAPFEKNTASTSRGDSHSKVWKGIDQNGHPSCGNKSVQLAWSANITEYTGIVQVIHANNGITLVSSAENTHLVQP